MPEGHTIHRLAEDYLARFGGRKAHVTSPQGKFTAAAALLTGMELTTAEAHGKHLFLRFENEDWTHIHLGLFGKVTFGPAPAPPPTDTVRLRLTNDTAYVDLRGPTTCTLITDTEKQAVHDRLGPDPLREDAEPARAYTRVSRSRTTIAALLMDQKVIAGVGNVYRAEVLFRHGIDPYRPGKDITRTEWDAMWTDLVALMRGGVRDNRIDTVRPEHEPDAMGRPPRKDDHGGEVYVYRRANLPCHICGGEIRTAGLAARNLFWCPTCQAAQDRSPPREGTEVSAPTGDVRPVATPGRLPHCLKGVGGAPTRRTGRKPKYVQYEDFRPARREHAPDAAP